MTNVSRTDAEMRLFLQENSMPVTETGCWLWLSNVDKDGYGKIRHMSKDFRCHRLSYLYNVGPLIPGQLIMHTCDVPSCVNPRHLVQGTSLENMADKIRKGRLVVAKGETHYKRLPTYKRPLRYHTAKLAIADVLEARRLFGIGLPKLSIAKRFGVTEGAIHAIVIRRTWNHI